MKRKQQFIILLILSATIFFLWFRIYPYSLSWGKESNSFFALTPDYFQWIFSQPDGLSVVIANFLVQFYRWPLIGAIIQTFFTIAVFYSSIVILKKCNTPVLLQWAAIVPSIVLWIIQFNETKTNLSVQVSLFAILFSVYISLKKRTSRLILLILVYPFFNLKIFILFAFISILTEIFKYKKFNIPSVHIKKEILISYAFSILIIFGAFFYLYQNKKYKETEKNNQIEYLAYTQRWDKLLNTIGKKEKYNEKELRYILLALSNKGILADYIFNYPINSEELFLFSGDITKEGCFFNQLFFSHIGVYNEALHQAFQESVNDEFGMSFRVLMNLIKFNTANGNKELKDKYIKVLSKATCYSKWIQKQKSTTQTQSSAEEKQKECSPFLTQSTLENLYNITQCENKNAYLNHYYLCTLLIRKNLQAFTSYLNRNKFIIEDKIPIHYYEALILAETQGFKIEGITIPPILINKFREFQSYIGNKDMKSITSKYKHTYWYNYYFMTFPQDTNKEILNISLH